tara:strand:- start:1232 stop:1456 length:225 start_codon:yes stop_codon:yes gene_type:complete
MTFKMKYKNLRGIVDQLYGASKKHKKQAEKLEKHIDKMQDNSPLTKKGPCWHGYEMIGMKKKGGRNVPNCVPKK